MAGSRGTGQPRLRKARGRGCWAEGRGKWVSGRGPKPGAQGESVGFGEGGRELLGHAVRPGVHGANGERSGGRPRGFIRGLKEGVPGGWVAGDLLRQGVAPPERRRAGWLGAQGRGLLGWSPS